MTRKYVSLLTLFFIPVILVLIGTICFSVWMLMHLNAAHDDAAAAELFREHAALFHVAFPFAYPDMKMKIEAFDFDAALAALGKTQKDIAIS